MARKLKVYRTPMGFYDAVVAAPSQAAALKVWGVTGNLFAEGLAQVVTDDPALEAQARERPGEIIRQSRGDAPAAPSKPTPRARSVSPGVDRRRKASPPDRSALDAAEAALEAAKAAAEAKLREIAQERAALDVPEREVRDAGRRDVARAEAAVDRASRAFRAAQAKARDG